MEGITHWGGGFTGAAPAIGGGAGRSDPNTGDNMDDTMPTPSSPPPETPGSDDLATPVLLIAMPQVQDPFFHKSVVLLLQHSDEGSAGLIVNRPTGLQVSEVLAGMEMRWGGDESAVTWFGGPVAPQTGTVLFAPDEDGGVDGVGDGDGGDGPGGTGTLVTGLALTQNVAVLNRLAPAPPDHFRLFLGYAGWGEGQLMEEFLRNDWLTAPVVPDLVFAPRPEDAWTGALQSVGVDPSHLPSWTAANDDGSAN